MWATPDTLAIMDALEKHNARNKGKEVLYLNYAAVDPDLTNSKCSYWHFRLDADTSGCLLLARNPRALKRFAAAFEARGGSVVLREPEAARELLDLAG